MLETTRDQINREGFRIQQNNTVFGFKGEPGKRLGTNYLDTAWHSGQVTFYRTIQAPGAPPLDSLDQVAVRLDLLAGEVEFLAGYKDVRAVKADQVKEFSVRYPDAGNRRFVNVREYAGKAVPVRGFFEKLVDGKLSLLAHHSIFVKKANYNPALNVGTKDDELVKRTEWYLATGQEVQKLSPGRRAVLEVMADKRPQIEAYLKTANPDYRSAADLAKLVRYYNNL
ncbi:hypothetical protein GCM10023187_07410 [Nibrella viscosa]|uniref:Uncharacterized protein n=2 Tax=Nibrella viscosa TaxID=1084524 RepID=A0ABP8JYK1_9BACT